MYKFSKRSLEKLATCHPELQLLAKEAIKAHDCSVVWGRRTEEQQNTMFKNGVSKLQYPNSKHNSDPSMAMDLLPYIGGKISWEHDDVIYFSGIVLGVAAQLLHCGQMTYKVRWGGNWSTNPYKSWKDNSFFDGGHFELRI